VVKPTTRFIDEAVRRRSAAAELRELSDIPPREPHPDEESLRDERGDAIEAFDKATSRLHWLVRDEDEARLVEIAHVLHCCMTGESALGYVPISRRRLRAAHRALFPTPNLSEGVRRLRTLLLEMHRALGTGSTASDVFDWFIHRASVQHERLSSLDKAFVSGLLQATTAEKPKKGQVSVSGAIARILARSGAWGVRRGDSKENVDLIRRKVDDALRAT
jgi:hypothetical protein